MSITKELQAKIIQKAWEDEIFKQQFTANPKEALKNVFDIEMPEDLDLQVMEEAPKKVFFILPPSPASLDTDNTDVTMFNTIW